MNEKTTKIINGKTYIFEDGKWITKRPTNNLDLDPHDPDYGWDWDLQNKR